MRDRYSTVQHVSVVPVAGQVSPEPTTQNCNLLAGGGFFFKKKKKEKKPEPPDSPVRDVYQLEKHHISHDLLISQSVAIRVCAVQFNSGALLLLSLVRESLPALFMTFPRQ